MIRLLPMNEDQFAEFATNHPPAFARDKIAAGSWSGAEALELSRKAFAELLPRGLATTGNHLYVNSDAGQDCVGTLWIAELEQAGRRIAFVYDVYIQPEHRRRGYAAGAFRALEAEAVRLGLEGIALHVFGHNGPAQALYHKLGYRITDLNMVKDLV